MSHVTVLSAPARIALVDGYDVVVYGLAHMLEPFRDRIEVVQLDVNEPVSVDVDIALYDTFAQPESDHRDFRALLENPHAAKAAIYTWSFDPQLVAAARRSGIHGYLAKSLPAAPAGFRIDELTHASAALVFSWLIELRDRLDDTPLARAG